jgi:hypothetical protein
MRAADDQTYRLDTLRLLRWASLVVPLAFAVVFGVASWTSARDAARDHAAVSARLTAEFALRLVRIQDRLITASEEFVLRFHPDGAPDVTAHRFLHEIHARAGAGQGVGLISPQGDFLLSSLTHPPRGNVGDRDYLALARDPAATGLFFDRIRLQPGDVDALVVARRHQGLPEGVWASALDVETILSFLEGVAAAPGEVAWLLRGDGKLLIRHPRSPEPRMLDPDHPATRLAQAGGRGGFVADGPIDGVPRYFAMEPVGDLGLLYQRLLIKTHAPIHVGRSS